MKDIMLTAAIVTAGAWALFRYDLIESNAARVKLDLELRRAQSQIQMSARMEQTVIKAGDKFIISGLFLLKNIGSRDIVVSSDQQPPVTMYKIDVDGPQPTPRKDSRVEAYFYKEDGGIQDGLSIDVGNEISMPFILRASEPGFYLISVSVPVASNDLSEAEKDQGDDWTWSDQRIVEIR